MLSLLSLPLIQQVCSANCNQNTTPLVAGARAPNEVTDSAMTPGSAAQVVALLLRSSGKVDAPLPGWHHEQDFAHMLNRVLPDTIRALGWADVPRDFHARCDAGFQSARWSRYE